MRALPPDANDVLARLHFVEEAWIDKQHRYFTAKVASQGGSSGRVKRLRNALLVVILVVVVMLFPFGEALHHREIGMGISMIGHFSRGEPSWGESPHSPAVMRCWCSWARIH